MKKLFAIYIGGAHKDAYVELHDIRFVIADSIEDSYKMLQKSWWGTLESLHIDAHGVLDHIDGYKVHLKSKPSPNQKDNLYFVNLGGYNPSEFTELHKNVFLVAENEADAKQKAVKMCDGWHQPHKDNQFAVDKIINVGDQIDETMFIHLEKDSEVKEFQFKCEYIPIGEYS